MELIRKITLKEGLIILAIWLIGPAIIRLNGIREVSMVALTFLILAKNNKRIDFRVSKGELFKMFGAIFLAFVFQVVWNLMAIKWIKVQPAAENQRIIVNILQQGGWGTIFMLFNVLITAPLLEELIFRGLMQEYISKNKKLAFVASWFIFAGIHLLASLNANPSISKILVEFVPYGVLSFIFCWYYYKHQNLGKNIVLHFINNFIAAILVFLPSLTG